MNNIITLSFLLFRSNKKSKFIHAIIFLIFFLVLFLTNTLFSSFEKTFNISTVTPPLFIITKTNGELDLQNNTPLRKSCIDNKTMSLIQKKLKDRFLIKEGLIFTTFFTNLKTNEKNNVIVELTNSENLKTTTVLKKNSENLSNNKRSINICVNNAFTKLFDLSSDYLAYINDFFGNYFPLRLKVKYVITEDEDTKPRCYIDLDTIKPFLSIPKDFSLPLFIYPLKNYKPNIFSISFMNMKSYVSNVISIPNISIESFYQIDKSNYTLFKFYLKVLFIVVTVIILILLYATSISYFINFNFRKKDFAVFKAFGLTSRKLYWIMFLENFYTTFLAFITSIVLNFLISITVKGYVTPYLILSFKFSFPGFITLTIILLLMSFLSILKAYFYIAKKDSLISFLECS